MANSYMPLFTGDYKRDTEHLSTEEHGAYLLILMALWDQNGRIKSDPKYLSRITRVSLRRWPQFWAELKGFFYEENGQIGHRRIDKETQKVAVISQKRSLSARKKWSKKPKENNETSDANAKQVLCTQTKGLGITTKVVNTPNLAPDGAAALEVLRASCAESGHASAELRKMEMTIIDYLDGRIFLKDRWSVDTFSERLGQQLRASNLVLAVQGNAPVSKTRPDLKAITGGKP